MTNTERPATREGNGLLRDLISRIDRIEIIAAAAVTIGAVLLVIIEPNVLEAPFENANTLLFTFGGTVIAAGIFVALLWFRVPALARIVVLGVPFAVVNWWLISPYFIDDVIDEAFEISLTDEAAPATTVAPLDDRETGSGGQSDEPSESTGQPDETESAEVDAPAEPEGPTLLGTGQFIGLAGHEGTGDAGLIQNPDGSYILRFENFDIENGPDLVVYLVPGADQVSLPEGSINLGALKGNIGDQNYELPSETELPPGPYTALVWCEAFDVEFVGATVTI